MKGVCLCVCLNYKLKTSILGTKEYVVCSFNVLVIWIICYRFLGLVILSLYIMDDKTDWWEVVALDACSISSKYSCIAYSNIHYMSYYSLFYEIRTWTELESRYTFSLAQIMCHCTIELEQQFMFSYPFTFQNSFLGKNSKKRIKYCLRRKKFMHL